MLRHFMFLSQDFLMQLMMPIQITTLWVSLRSTSGMQSEILTRRPWKIIPCGVR